MFHPDILRIFSTTILCNVSVTRYRNSSFISDKIFSRAKTTVNQFFFFSRPYLFDAFVNNFVCTCVYARVCAEIKIELRDMELLKDQGVRRYVYINNNNK